MSEMPDEIWVAYGGTVLESPIYLCGSSYKEGRIKYIRADLAQPAPQGMGEDELVEKVLAWDDGHPFHKGDKPTIINVIRALQSAGVLRGK